MACCWRQPSWENWQGKALLAPCDLVKDAGSLSWQKFGNLLFKHSLADRVGSPCHDMRGSLRHLRYSLGKLVCSNLS
jgi:hypothetical protein